METLETSSWFSELGMEDPSSINPYEQMMDFFDLEEYYAPTITTNNIIINGSSLSPEPYSSMEQPSLHNPFMTSDTAPAPVEVHEHRPAKQLKRSNKDRTPIILTFGNPGLTPEVAAGSEVLMTSNGSFTSLDEASKSAARAKVVPKGKKTGGRRSRPPSETYDHIIAERKRREQLSQCFMALSAIVPGLKKMDKTSVLGDAITYLKQLKGRVQTLEEQATKQTIESVSLLKSQPLPVHGEEEVSEEQRCNYKQLFPEIEVKRCDKTVLVKVHCENHKGVLIKLLMEIERLNLAITNSSSIATFGSLGLDVTIIAEMEEQFDMTMQELVRNIRPALECVDKVEELRC